jgi:hypothetical protein
VVLRALFLVPLLIAALALALAVATPVLAQSSAEDDGIENLGIECVAGRELVARGR